MSNASSQQSSDAISTPAAISPADAVRIRDYLQAQPRAMTSLVARELGLAEVHVVRCLTGEQVQELVVDRFADMMDRLTGFGRVHVIVSSGAATLEAFGEFGNFSTWGEYFNVQTKSLDMHIRYREIGAIFAVEKPSHMDGVSTLSFQFYDCRGTSVMKVFLTFGTKAPSPECRVGWEAFRAEFAIANAAAP